MCDCEDKTILAESEGMYIASESWCKEHGYQNSCWMCHWSNCTTELCCKHRERISGYRWALTEEDK